MTKSTMSFLPAVASLVIAALSCTSPPGHSVADVPQWAKDAVWYQVFPERFSNGDPSNDPTPADIGIKEGRAWAVSPWTSDWYALPRWERLHDPGFYENVFNRYYGGDIQGILDKLDYLQELGVTAIYLNPVFEARSLHKYDASSYHHIDDNFGPDPAGDKRTVAGETNDPGTWQWTSADRLFLKLIDEVHARGMRIIIDGVFNHSGTGFWAFQDVIANQERSPYASWYDVRSWDDPSTSANEFAYKGWWDYRTLPEFAEGDSGFVPAVRDHFIDITRRWMDPDGNGDPSDGIDGWRLDVANEVSPVFWKQWRTFVKDLNPDAYIVGEIWDDAAEWLSGDRFDAVMNYPFARAAIRFFVDTDEHAYDARDLDDELARIRNGYPEETNFILQNLLDSHDTDRLASMIRNPNRTYDDKSGPRFNPGYDTRRPTNADRDVQKIISLFQVSYIGAPMVFYGTEAGMWGGDDPDDRKPMVWPEHAYEPERVSYDQKTYTEPDEVSFDAELFSWYTSIFALRSTLEPLRRGTFERLVADGDVYVFERATGTDTVIVAMNRHADERSALIPRTGSWTDRVAGGTADLDRRVHLAGRTGYILVRPRETVR